MLGWFWMGPQEMNLSEPIKREQERHQSSPTMAGHMFRQNSQVIFEQLETLDYVLLAKIKEVTDFLVLSEEEELIAQSGQALPCP